MCDVAGELPGRLGGCMDVQTVGKVVFFTDVHEFSKAMVELGDKSAEFIQGYYEVCGDAVVRRGGEIIKYIGDAVLVIFPEGKEEDAIRAAIEARKGFQDLRERLKIKHPVEMEVGIGSGTVTIGEFGHSSHREIDLFGEVVNETAIIGHHLGIAILKPVYEAVKDTFQCNKLPDMKAKWRPEPLGIWEIVH